MADDEQSSPSFAEPLLRVSGLCKNYGEHYWLPNPKPPLRALDNVNLILGRRSTLAVVGESGAGKSTLARCIARLEEPSSGEIWWEQTNLLDLHTREMVNFRTQIQLIFQDAAAAMNPRMTAEEIVTEPLRIRRRSSLQERWQRAGELMELVGLPGQWMAKRPLEFSGGQLQRLTIARALALQPKLLVLDEALAGLDLSLQAQMANLLLELQQARGLSYLFITHDLNLAGRLADRVVVMREGKIVECGETREIFQNPSNPYTRMLIDRENSSLGRKESP